MTLRAPLAAVALSALVAAAATAERVESIAVSEVTAGQRGYGLSVFSGEVPERFDVEVLGVWRNIQPDTSFILARLTGQGLERSGVIAGMSGSPVYLDGRLAGAVAFAWPFSEEAIAGITPIETMRSIEREAAESPAARSVAAGAWPLGPRELAAREFDRSLLVSGLARFATPPLADAATGLQWLTVGLGDSSRGLFAEGVGAVSAAGEAAGEPAGLDPGSAVAAVLMDGDLRIAATGTVTDRAGDRLLAFGHTFLGLGPIEVPMASAEVITVLSNRMSSFKLANVGRVVGAFDFDHPAGIGGEVGASAPTVPVELLIRGDGERRYDVEVADVPVVTPTLVAMAVLGSLEANVDSTASESLDLAAAFDLGEHGRLELEQSFDAPGAPMAAALHLLAFTGYLLQNPLAEVTIEAVEIELERFREPRTHRVVGAHASKSVVRPGERIAVNLDLVAHRGGRRRETVEIVLPTGLPEGRYSLLVGDGVSADVARLAVEQAEPVNIRQALELLGSLHSRRDLVVLGVYPANGLAVAGETLPRLPGSMRSLWGAAATGSARPLTLALAQEESVELDVPLAGMVRIDLEVERREVLAGERPASRTGDGGRR